MEQKQLRWNDSCYNNKKNTTTIKWKDSYGGDNPPYKWGAMQF